MRYKKADEILPEDVLELVQQYVDGETIHIPRKAENRRDWGEGTGYRAELLARNDAIRRDRAQGAAIRDLAQQYHLSEKSIRRILQDM